MPAKCSKQRGALDYGIRHRERGQVRVERPHDATRVQCNLPLMGGAVFLAQVANTVPEAGFQVFCAVDQYAWFARSLRIPSLRATTPF